MLSVIWTSLVIHLTFERGVRGADAHAVENPRVTFDSPKPNYSPLLAGGLTITRSPYVVHVTRIVLY